MKKSFLLLHTIFKKLLLLLCFQFITSNIVAYPIELIVMTNGQRVVRLYSDYHKCSYVDESIEGFNLLHDELKKNQNKKYKILVEGLVQEGGPQYQGFLSWFSNWLDDSDLSHVKLVDIEPKCSKESTSAWSLFFKLANAENMREAYTILHQPRFKKIVDSSLSKLIDQIVYDSKKIVCSVPMISYMHQYVGFSSAINTINMSLFNTMKDAMTAFIDAGFLQEDLATPFSTLFYKNYFRKYICCCNEKKNNKTILNFLDAMELPSLLELTILNQIFDPKGPSESFVFAGANHTNKVMALLLQCGFKVDEKRSIHAQTVTGKTCIGLDSINNESNFKIVPLSAFDILS